MDKFVIYCTASDQLMVEGQVPFIGTEKEVKHVLKNEVVDAKRYEIKPISFMKEWAKKIKKQETDNQSASYRFSPSYPEFHYRRSEDEQRYLLIVGQEGIRKSGKLVKTFASAEEAAKMATQSAVKLNKEFPELSFYILDLEKYGYVSRIDKEGITEYSRFGTSKRKTSSRTSKQSA
jgi:hypothetical protein